MLQQWLFRSSPCTGGRSCSGTSFGCQPCLTSLQVPTMQHGTQKHNRQTRMQLASLIKYGETESIPHSTPPKFGRCNTHTEWCLLPYRTAGPGYVYQQSVSCTTVSFLMPPSGPSTLWSVQLCAVLQRTPAAAAMRLSLDVYLARLGLLQRDRGRLMRGHTHTSRMKRPASLTLPAVCWLLNK